MQLQLLPDNLAELDQQAEKLYSRQRESAWRELLDCCRVIGRYRNIYENDYYHRRLREAKDILAAMNENEERVKLARKLFNNGNYTDARKVLAKVVW